MAGRKPGKKDKKSEKVEAKSKKTSAKKDDDEDEEEVTKVKKTSKKAKEKDDDGESKKKRPAYLTGRKAGVSYKVKGKYISAIFECVDEIEDTLEEIKKHCDSFTEKGNKSGARKARKAIMEMLKKGKTLRNAIQEGKENMVEKVA